MVRSETYKSKSSAKNCIESIQKRVAEAPGRRGGVRGSTTPLPPCGGGRQIEGAGSAQVA
ncbi:MAG: YegP family protein [Rhizobium sp.]|nr:YegP family protein [Rhizobium sp.]